MYFLFNTLILPMTYGFVAVQIHRNAIYQSPMPCDFIRNATWSNSATIQSCIWECDYEQDCQTATYFHNLMLCSLFYEVCKVDAILPSGGIQASVICNQKEHNPVAQCPATTATMLSMMTTAKQEMTLLTTTNETVYGIWNTTAGGNITPSTPGTNSTGKYVANEMPNNAFDNRIGTKYTSIGACIYPSGNQSLQCSENTGFYFTLQRGPSSLLSVQFYTANDYPERDPLTITIEGSNQSLSLLTLGSSWTLFYSGSTGLQSITDRNTSGISQPILNNLNWYSSYRILVTSKRGINYDTQYSEVKLFGYL